MLKSFAKRNLIYAVDVYFMMKKIAELKNYFSRHLKLTPIFIAVLFLNGNLFAAEAVWTGDAGTNDWATLGNWSGITDVSELENADTVTIPTDATPYPEASAAVTLNGKLIIGDGASVTFNGTVNLNSITLGTGSTLDSKANLTAGTITLGTGSTLNSMADFTAGTLVAPNDTTINFNQGTDLQLNGRCGKC